MTLTIELEDPLVAEIGKVTATTGLSASAYVEGAVRQKLESERREMAIDDALRRLRESAVPWTREGQSWKDISHEGHSY